jgi:hypothetical protein
VILKNATLTARASRYAPNDNAQKPNATQEKGLSANKNKKKSVMSVVLALP